MKLRRIIYVCQRGHELQFGHLVKKNGKFDSGSPVVCSCGAPFTLALIGRSAAPNTVSLI